jgi:hypothetical protein
VTITIVDDQLLGDVLRGRRPRELRGKSIFTTGYWYVRLCQAVLASDIGGILSKPFDTLPVDLRDRAVAALIELPSEIGLVSLRDLSPIIGRLRRDHDLKALSMEALAAAVHLEASMVLSAPSPRLETALASEGRRVKVRRP